MAARQRPSTSGPGRRPAMTSRRRAVPGMAGSAGCPSRPRARPRAASSGVRVPVLTRARATPRTGPRGPLPSPVRTLCRGHFVFANRPGNTPDRAPGCIPEHGIAGQRVVPEGFSWGQPGRRRRGCGRVCRSGLPPRRRLSLARLSRGDPFSGVQKLLTGGRGSWVPSWDPGCNELHEMGPLLAQRGLGPVA